jgi:hypothetical protein
VKTGVEDRIMASTQRDRVYLDLGAFDGALRFLDGGLESKRLVDNRHVIVDGLGNHRNL